MNSTKDDPSTYINSININSETDFPYLVLHVKNNTATPLTPGFRVYHWHDDLQFVYVLSGNISVNTLEKKELLSAGEGIFINKNVVHMIDKIDECEYRCFIFPERLVSFYPGSPVSRLTGTITDNHAISLIPFRNDESWCRAALTILNKMFFLEADTSDLYCYEVLSSLCNLWLLLLKNTSNYEHITETAISIRMRHMLQFIETNYSDNISLTDLAASAGISTSEALHCFKLTMHTTPYRYLIDYRLAKATDLLENTDLPISQISSMTGFSQQAYFGKCFREKMLCCPREYRKKHIKER